MQRRSKRIPQTEEQKYEYVNSGSTMLNLALSDSVNGGFPLGYIATIPGASAAGKTILILNMFAEASINSKFNDYKLIYDDVERRSNFDINHLFGKLADRLITPSGILFSKSKEADEIGFSHTIQDLRNRMLMLRKEGKPFIYVADGLDAFSTDEELDKEMRRAIALAKSKEAAKKIAGSFNAEKAKITGQILRMINDVIANTNSLFILTQQLRQKMNAMPFESPWVTSGGEAPYYWSEVRPFLIKAAPIKNGKIKIGTSSRIRMDKNSITGKLRDIEFDIYYDLGIDDIGSMVKFLITEGHWKSGSWIEAPEFRLKEHGKEALIKAIEKTGRIERLKRIVQKVWNAREESLKLDRKRRYE